MPHDTFMRSKEPRPLLSALTVDTFGKNKGIEEGGMNYITTILSKYTKNAL
jgi:hypothetical protein